MASSFGRRLAVAEARVAASLLLWSLAPKAQRPALPAVAPHGDPPGSGRVLQPAQELEQPCAFGGRQTLHHSLLGFVDDAIERFELLLAGAGQGHDVASAVGRIHGAVDQARLLEVAKEGDDVAAVHAGTAREVGLAGGSRLLEGGEEA